MTWIDVASNFNTELSNGPVAIQAWVGWLSLTATLAILWAPKQPVARVVLVAGVLNVCAMMFLFAHLGMVPLLGSVHLVFMAPAVVYAWRRLPSLPSGEWHTRWVRVFGATWVISLWIDAINVARWIAGARATGF